ncbi:hypothetical protein BRD17_09005 [Halobacteriales archaeon SW_7_68_16]|nr:MAG: hypothetical protein BRD17_09005 [Halobacteriales archaeon SW_7_68_16]
MVAATHGRRDRRIDFTRSEEWVVHHVAVEELERARSESTRPAWWATAVLEEIESGEPSLSPFEAWRLRHALAQYAGNDHTPQRDADAATTVVDRLDGAFEATPVAAEAGD